jgi:hypothetical protein
VIVRAAVTGLTPVTQTVRFKKKMDRGRSEKSLRAPLILYSLLILSVPSAMAMNDTEAVVAESLFPVEGGTGMAGGEEDGSRTSVGYWM